MTSEPLAVFVYGTLQRGQQRAAMWPRSPQRIDPAVTSGRLYDLGPYPALLPGEGLVAGELWHFSPEDLAVTLRALDAIEGYGQNGVDLYVRQVVTCWTPDGQTYQAYAYFYADPDDLASAHRLPADGQGLCRWPDERSAR